MDDFTVQYGVSQHGWHRLRRGYFVTSTSERFWYSTNSVSWTQRFPGFIGGAAFGHGTFVIAGGAALIYQSGNVGGTPSILVEPQDRAVVVNNPASFSVLAAGAEPLAYQWPKNNAPIGGATNAGFSLASVALSDAGGYRVVITNSFGSVTSRVAQLTVSFLEIHSYAGITILGVPGKTYQIEASPQAGGSWTVLTNLVLPRSPFIWTGYDSPNVGTRVYRAAEVQ